LREEIGSLRAELARLFDERLTIEYEQLPTLRSRYAELFGDLERTLQLRALELSERRRIVELISLKLDRGQKLDDRTIDLVVRSVRTEYGRVRARLHAASWSGGGTEERDSRPGRSVPRSADGSDRRRERRADEVRMLYRTLVRRLHPDVVGADQDLRRTWDMVQRAYASHDIDLLRNLVVLGKAVTADLPTDVHALELEVVSLRRSIAVEEQHLADSRESELYAMKDRLTDESFVLAHRRAKEEEVGALEESIGKCDAFLTGVLKGKRIPAPDELRETWTDFVENVYINNR